MKKMLLAIAVSATWFTAGAQPYLDSLFKEYTTAYRQSRVTELLFTNSLFEAAEKTFTIDNPVMVYAMKQSGMEDSTAIMRLGAEAMGCFLDDRFMRWACVHYERTMDTVLNVYTDELCRQISIRMKDAGKIPRAERPQRFETATNESAVGMTGDKQFIKRVAQLRADLGQEMILQSLDCNMAYLYVHCPFVRAYITDACAGMQAEKYMKYKRDEQMRMNAVLRDYLVTGNKSVLTEFVQANNTIAILTAAGSKIGKRIKELKAEEHELHFRPVTVGNKLTLSYIYAGNTTEIPGGLMLDVQWKDHKWKISNARYIPEKDIKDKEALLKIAAAAKDASSANDVKP